MTTLVEAHDELEAALVAAGVSVGSMAGVAPPGAIVYGDGIEPSHVMRGAVDASFRVTMVGGTWTAKGASRALRGVIDVTLPALRELDGWRVGAVSPDSIVNIAGSTLLSADVVASRQIDI